MWVAVIPELLDEMSYIMTKDQNLNRSLACLIDKECYKDVL